MAHHTTWETERQIDLAVIRLRVRATMLERLRAVRHLHEFDRDHRCLCGMTEIDYAWMGRDELLPCARTLTERSSSGHQAYDTPACNK